MYSFWAGYEAVRRREVPVSLTYWCHIHTALKIPDKMFITGNKKSYFNQKHAIQLTQLCTTYHWQHTVHYHLQLQVNINFKTCYLTYECTHFSIVSTKPFYWHIWHIFVCKNYSYTIVTTCQSRTSHIKYTVSYISKASHCIDVTSLFIK